MAAVFYYPKGFEKFKDELLEKYKNRKFIRDERRFLETVFYLFDLVRNQTYIRRYDYAYISKHFHAKKSIQRVIPNSHRVLNILVKEGLLEENEMKKIKDIPYAQIIMVE